MYFLFPIDMKSLQHKAIHRGSGNNAICRGRNDIHKTNCMANIITPNIQ